MDVTYFLRTYDAAQANAWQRYFANYPQVQISTGNIFDLKADAIISPANSFGFMDGGIDLVYSKFFGWHVQERLQAKLRAEYDGELPVGLAVLVETDHTDIPYLISAPTLRTPVSVANTVNAYLAFRASLRLIAKINSQQPGAIRSVLCPGLATGTGEMPVDICAKQMLTAYQQIVVDGQNWLPTSVNEALIEHYRLLRPDEAI